MPAPEGRRTRSAPAREVAEAAPGEIAERDAAKARQNPPKTPQQEFNERMLEVRPDLDEAALEALWEQFGPKPGRSLTAR